MHALPKTIKYLRINVTMEVKNLYIEKYKTQMKKIKDISKWKYILCSSTRRINFVNMAIIPITLKYFSQKQKKKSLNSYGNIKEPEESEQS